MGFRNLPERAKASWSSPSCSPLPDSTVWALHHCNPCTLWRVWVTLTLNRKHYQNVERFLSTYGLIRDRYQHFQRFLSAIRSNINIMILNLKKKKPKKRTPVRKGAEVCYQDASRQLWYMAFSSSEGESSGGLEVKEKQKARLYSSCNYRSTIE